MANYTLEHLLLYNLIPYGRLVIDENVRKWYIIKVWKHGKPLSAGQASTIGKEQTT